MVYCFAPTCGHSSEGNTCKFFAFPSATKQNDEYKRWIRLIRYELIFKKNSLIGENLMNYVILSEIYGLYSGEELTSGHEGESSNTEL